MEELFIGFPKDPLAYKYVWAILPPTVGARIDWNYICIYSLTLPLPSLPVKNGWLHTQTLIVISVHVGVHKQAEETPLNNSMKSTHGNTLSINMTNLNEYCVCCKSVCLLNWQWCIYSEIALTSWETTNMSSAPVPPSSKPSVQLPATIKSSKLTFNGSAISS